MNYDEKNWQNIINYLNAVKPKESPVIPKLNRAQLLNDALAFVQREKLSLTVLLHLIEHLTNEADYIVWYPGFKIFTWLREKFINTEYHVSFKVIRRQK